MTLPSFLKYSIFLTALNFLQVIPQEQHPNDDLIALKSDTIINPHNFQYLLNPTECVCGENRGEDVIKIDDFFTISIFQINKNVTCFLAGVSSRLCSFNS